MGWERFAGSWLSLFIASARCIDLAQALVLAAQVAAGPELAMARIKTLCRNAYANTLQQQLEQEAQCMVQSQETEESREGIAAFLEKRAANFRQSAAVALTK